MSKILNSNLKTVSINQAMKTNSIFNQIIDNVVLNLSLLPLLHTCDGYGFREIVKSKELRTHKCDNFNQNYLYTYYGIPSYRISTKKSTKSLAYFPVCFILDPHYISNIEKIFPFDSGAFIKIPEVKNEHFHDDMKLSDFLLEPEIASAAKVVQKFYSTNQNYILNQPTVKSENFKPTDFEAQSYTSLITNRTNTIYDSRVSTIELILTKELKLNENSLLQIILPKAFLDDEDLKLSLAKDFNIAEPLTYETVLGRPHEYFGTVLNLYNTFMGKI